MTMCLALANVERDADVWIERAPAIGLKIRGGVEHEPVRTSCGVARQRDQPAVIVIRTAGSSDGPFRRAGSTAPV